jgi:hypothetical protein
MFTSNLSWQYKCYMRSKSVLKNLLDISPQVHDICLAYFITRKISYVVNMTRNRGLHKIIHEYIR